MEEREKDTNKSSFRMFWGNATFTNEPLWYRLAVIILMLIALVIIIKTFKELAATSIVVKKLSQLRIDSLLNIFKDK